MNDARQDNRWNRAKHLFVSELMPFYVQACYNLQAFNTGLD
jgi:hypothetical protein